MSFLVVTYNLIESDFEWLNLTVLVSTVCSSIVNGCAFSRLSGVVLGSKRFLYWDLWSVLGSFPGRRLLHLTGSRQNWSVTLRTLNRLQRFVAQQISDVSAVIASKWHLWVKYITDLHSLSFQNLSKCFKNQKRSSYIILQTCWKSMKIHINLISCNFCLIICSSVAIGLFL